MPGPAFLRDIPNATLKADLLDIQTVTQTTTGTDQNMITGDGRCVLMAAIKATSLTAITVKVQQSTLTNSGFADITNAYVSATTDGWYSVSFDRDDQYIQAVVVISGTTAGVAAVCLEQLKTF